MSTSQARVAEALQDRYEIEKVLGHGGSAVVYLATDRLLERLVAVKVLRAAPGAGENGQERLRREAHIVARLEHPNIVQLYDIRTLDDDGLALIMQYVRGKTLKRIIQEQGAFTCALAAKILVDVSRALAYAHAQQIVHRDMKPDNVYYDPDSATTHVSDFGIARRWGGASTLTLPGSALGTPAYMSPEQIDGLELDGRSDLYSLALLGYELLSGTAPWAGETLFSVLEKQKRGTLEPLEDIRSDVPHHLSEAIQVALNKDPNQRWPDAGAFAEHILSAPVPDTPPPPMSAQPAVPLEDAPTVALPPGWTPADAVQTPQPSSPPPRPQSSSTPAPSRPAPPARHPQPVEPPASTSTPQTGGRSRVPGGFRAPPGSPGGMSLPEDTEYYTPGAEDAGPTAASEMIAVESPVDFARVIRYDVYQLMLDGDIVFAHGPCGGGTMRIDPPAFVETRRGKLKRVETDPDDPIALICNECDARFEGFTRNHFETVLTRFLARPRPSALETYRLTADVSFVDPAWKPHQRRRRPDRRAEETRYEVDPSLMGRRRMGKDRRRDPELRDVPPAREEP